MARQQNRVTMDTVDVSQRLKGILDTHAKLEIKAHMNFSYNNTNDMSARK